MWNVFLVNSFDAIFLQHVTLDTFTSYSTLLMKFLTLLYEVFHQKFKLGIDTTIIANFLHFPWECGIGWFVLFERHELDKCKRIILWYANYFEFLYQVQIERMSLFQCEKSGKDAFFLSVRVFLFYLQEPFAQALVNFLKRRCPQLFGINDKDLPKAVQLPAETITTTLSCLQHHIR